LVGGYQHVYQVAMEYPLESTEEGLGLFVKDGISILKTEFYELPWIGTCPDRNTRILFRAHLEKDGHKVNFFKYLSLHLSVNI
jgi:hypothetical protein